MTSWRKTRVDPAAGQSRTSRRATAEGIAAARGKPGDLPVGHTGSVNEIEEVMSEAHGRIRSSPVVRRPPKNSDGQPPRIFNRNDV